MAQSESKTAVVLALLGNTVLTATKGIAFWMTGSGSMLAETIHSIADTANQALLYVGIKKSERGPDALFPYGYGAERYLFSLFSAIGIFVLGCGVTVYHGIHNLLSPPELSFSWVSWVVLGIAFIVDGVVLLKVILSLKHEMARQGITRFIRSSTDPTAIAVLFEDGVACLGVIVAAAGIGLSYLTGSHVPDALGSIVIGLLLGAVAISLGLKNRELILGQAIPEEEREAIRRFLAAQPTVRGIRAFRSRVLGADTFRMKADVDFDGRRLGEAQAAWVAEQLPHLDSPEAIRRFSGEFGARVVEALGDEVDRIEAEMKARFPELRYIDLEAD
ncbi:MAG: cation diffusion facilitator family transporter [Deltaproteobacteria bacterium]|nr:MAG: cation diffusion facilitator family transporter [Deltaproteobacteria bacterium]